MERNRNRNLNEILNRMEEKMNELEQRIYDLELSRYEYDDDYETFKYWLGLWTSKLCDKINNENE